MDESKRFKAHNYITKKKQSSSWGGYEFLSLLLQQDQQQRELYLREQELVNKYNEGLRTGFISAFTCVLQLINRNECTVESVTALMMEVQNMGQNQKKEVE